MITKILD